MPCRSIPDLPLAQFGQDYMRKWSKNRVPINVLHRARSFYAGTSSKSMNTPEGRALCHDLHERNDGHGENCRPIGPVPALRHRNHALRILVGDVFISGLFGDLVQSAPVRILEFSRCPGVPAALAGSFDGVATPSKRDLPHRLNLHRRVAKEVVDHEHLRQSA
jgi:hypothetical protein